MTATENGPSGNQPGVSGSGVESAEADLASFGYRQQLRRSMGGYSSFALAFSMISITTTIFTLFPQPFQMVGGVAIWLWIPVTVATGAIACVYGHLAARLPVTGYAYQWSSRLVSPHLGWFTGWNALLATLVGSASIAVAFGTIFAPLFFANPTHGNVILLASVAVVAAVAINIVSIRFASRINDAGASAELFGTLGLTAVLAVGLLFFRDSQGPGVLFQTGSSQGSPITLTSIGLAFLLPVYTLLGWEGSADLAEETNDPRRNAPRAMIRSVLISGLAGFLVFAVFAMAIPGKLADTVNSTDFNPMVHVFDVQLGTAASDLLQVIVFMSVFSCLLANVAVATRTGFALARDGMLPFSRLWANVNDRTRTPVAPIVAVGAVAIGVNFLSAGQAANVTAITSVVCYVTYSSTMVAVMIAKRRGSIPDAGPGRFDMGRWLVPVAVVTLVWCVGICLFMTVPEANRAAGVTTLFFELAGGVWYLLRLRGKIVRGEAGPAVSGR